MAQHTATYSKIISPGEYNRIMTDEHLYIAVADKLVKDFVEKEVTGKANPEVVEIGCGPARITPLFLEIPNIRLTATESRKEIEGVGFKVEKVERIGPRKAVGGLYVYLLRK